MPLPSVVFEKKTRLAAKLVGILHCAPVFILENNRKITWETTMLSLDIRFALPWPSAGCRCAAYVDHVSITTKQWDHLHRKTSMKCFEDWKPLIICVSNITEPCLYVNMCIFICKWVYSLKGICWRKVYMLTEVVPYGVQIGKSRWKRWRVARSTVPAIAVGPHIFFKRTAIRSISDNTFFDTVP